MKKIGKIFTLATILMVSLSFFVGCKEEEDDDASVSAQYSYNQIISEDGITVYKQSLIFYSNGAGIATMDVSINGKRQIKIIQEGTYSGNPTKDGVISTRVVRLAKFQAYFWGANISMSDTDLNDALSLVPVSVIPDANGKNYLEGQVTIENGKLETTNLKGDTIYLVREK